MNGEAITSSNYATLYGSGAMTLTMGKYDAENKGITDTYKIEIASARVVDDNPVYYKNIYTDGTKKVGYLVYNHFSAGPTDNSTTYNQSLLNASNYFATNNIDEFILDLRYNNGGLVSCAQLLCTLLAPSENIGDELGYLLFNDHFAPRQSFMNMNSNLIQGGTNLKDADWSGIGMKYSAFQDENSQIYRNFIVGYINTYVKVPFKINNFSAITSGFKDRYYQIGRAHV